MFENHFHIAWLPQANHRYRTRLSYIKKEKREFHGKCIFRAMIFKMWSPDQQYQQLGNLLGIQITRPHPRSTESETLGVGPRNLGFIKSWGDSDADQSLRTTALDEAMLWIPFSPHQETSLDCQEQLFESIKGTISLTSGIFHCQPISKPSVPWSFGDCCSPDQDI